MSKIEVDVTFHPEWWHQNSGVCFGQDFFFDPSYRIRADQTMRKVLYAKFGDLGLGESDPSLRPIVGTDLLASGFLYSGIMGCPIQYSDNNPPRVICANLDDTKIKALAGLDLADNELWRQTIAQFEFLEQKFGYVDSHINLQGILNIALDLRGSVLFMDFYDQPDLAKQLLNETTRISLEIGRYISSKSKCLSHGVTAITAKTMPDIYLTSNCTVEMISQDLYDEFLLPFDQQLASAFQPFGVHHCGKTMEHVVAGYAKINNLAFAEVGAGSDIAKVRRFLPRTFLNLRYSPVRLKTVTKMELAFEVAEMAKAAVDNFSISCVGIDAETEDLQVRNLIESVKLL
jgi:hypothetical protein